MGQFRSERAGLRQFASEGAKVVLADTQVEEGERIAAELGDAAVYQQTDVTSEEDIANVATFLASDLAGYVNGLRLPVDGGATAMTQSSFSADILAVRDEFVAR